MIIEKETKRQGNYLSILGYCCEADKHLAQRRIDCHKESLINLKEYMEEELKFLEKKIVSYPGELVPERQIKVENEIKQLKVLIGNYK